MNKVLDNFQRSKTTIICFYIMLAAVAILLISNVMQYQFLNEGFFQILAGAKANDQRQLVASFIVIAAQIAVIITFIQWFRRAYHNLHKAKVKNLKMSEGWAAGGWFIPIASWFIPFQIMQDIWIKTREYGQSSNDEELGDHNVTQRPMMTLGIWWACWVGSNILGFVNYQLMRDNPGMSDLKMITILSIVANILSIVSILFIVKIIKESQNDQDAFLERWNSKDADSTFEISQSDDVLD